MMAVYKSHERESTFYKGVCMFIDESSDGQSRYDYIDQNETVQSTGKSGTKLKSKTRLTFSTPQKVRDKWLKDMEAQATRRANYSDHSLFDHLSEVLFG